MVDVFPPLHLDGQQQDVADELRPKLAGIIAPKVRAAEETADNRDEGCEHGGDERQGQSDEKLIDFIKEVHKDDMFLKKYLRSCSCAMPRRAA